MQPSISYICDACSDVTDGIHGSSWLLSFNTNSGEVTGKCFCAQKECHNIDRVFDNHETAIHTINELARSKVLNRYYPHKILIGEYCESELRNPVPSNYSEAEEIETWENLGGQDGYNPGGFYIDNNGDMWYCKFPIAGEPVLKNELLATKLYQLAGVIVPEKKPIKERNIPGIASRIIPNAVKNRNLLIEGRGIGLLSGFITDAWMANWDVVGNNPAPGKGWDNILYAQGSAWRIDAGGALLYGGTGKKKSLFTEKVIELETMLDGSVNKHTSAVFSNMQDTDIIESASRVVNIPDSAITDLVTIYCPGSPEDKRNLEKTLIARKNFIADRIPRSISVTPENDYLKMVNENKSTISLNYTRWGHST